MGKGPGDGNWKANAAAGYVAGAANELIFYSLDSYKILKQQQFAIRNVSAVEATARSGALSVGLPGWRHQLSSLYQAAKPLFRGSVPVIATGTGPSLGVFFACYATSKSFTVNTLTNNPRLSELFIGRERPPEALIQSTSTLVAAALAGIPASICAVPSDVIKKHMILTDRPQSFSSALRTVYQRSGVAGFFTGYKANVAKDVPVSVVKLFTYETICALMLHMRPHVEVAADALRELRRGKLPSWGRIQQQRLQQHHHGQATKLALPTLPSGASPPPPAPLGAWETATAGLLAGAFTAYITMPLDVINTQMKSPSATPAEQRSMIAAAKGVVKRSGSIRALWKGSIPRIVIFGVGSSFFWTIFSYVQQHVEPHFDSTK